MHVDQNLAVTNRLIPNHEQENERLICNSMTGKAMGLWQPPKLEDLKPRHMLQVYEPAREAQGMGLGLQEVPDVQSGQQCPVPVTLGQWYAKWKGQGV